MKLVAQFRVSELTPLEVVMSSLPTRSARWEIRRVLEGGFVGNSHAAINVTVPIDPNQDGKVISWVAHELITGTLDGREGSFVVQHVYPARIPEVGWSGRIVPGTGSGELKGISGTVIWSTNPDVAHLPDLGKPGKVEFDFMLPD